MFCEVYKLLIRNTFQRQEPSQDNLTSSTKEQMGIGCCDCFVSANTEKIERKIRNIYLIEKGTEE